MGMKRPSTFLLLALAICMGTSLSGADDPKYPGQLSIGVYKDELTSPIFYDTFVPIIYEFAVPVYKALDVTIRDWRGKCDTEKIAPSYTCPVFYHFEKLIERFEKEVVPRAWVVGQNVTSSKFPSVSVPSNMRVVVDFCNSIQKHFTGSITQQFSFEKYIDQLRSCPDAGELKFNREINDYVYNIKAIFKKMNDNYESEFSNKFFGETNAKTGPAFYVNAVTAHQNGLIMAYWVEKTRWTQAQLACNEQRIPEFLIKHQNLSNHVNELASKLHQGQIPSLPVEQISALYKLPLADCTFIENTGNYVVRVFIPVIKTDSSPKLYKLRTVTFIYKDEKQNQDQICQIKPISGKFLHDKGSGSIQLTDCESDSLCQVKGQMDSSVDLCVRSIFANSSQGVRRHCPFDCTPANETFNIVKLPIFSRVASDTWTITGRTKTGISIKCSENKDQILSLPTSGALEVKLPCGCSLISGSEVLNVESPCKARFEAEPQVTELTPVHFLKEDMLKSFQPGKSLNITSLPEGSTNFLPESAKKLDGSGLVDPQVKNRSTTTETSGGQLGALWALVILQLCIIIVIIVAAAYKYSIYRKSLTYSKERLVYNIYASPSDNSINEAGRTRPASSVIDNSNVL